VKLNRDQIILIGLFVFIIALSSIHIVDIFLFLTLFLILLSPKIALKSLKSIFLFNTSVTLGYIIKAYFTDIFDYNFLLLFNLRVFDITFLVFYIFSKINIIKAFLFVPNLQYLLLISLNQIKSYIKTYDEFNIALKSRVIKPLKDNNKKHFVFAMFYFFLKKSLHNSQERTMALKARGFFD